MRTSINSSVETVMTSGSSLMAEVGFSRFALPTGTTLSNATPGDGNDFYTATGGAELIYGGLGSDVITGSAGHDTIYGGRSQADLEDVADSIDGGAGNDLIFGNGGGDTLLGNAGNDVVYGGRGMDYIVGGGGNDTLYGGGGVAHGEDEMDYIYGGDGSDVILGNGGDDWLYGEDGSDALWGGLGNDAIWGGKGRDTLAGQDGNDWLYGGEDADRFYFSSNSGVDYVTDFVVGVDLIQIDSNINGTVLSQSQTILDTMVSYDSGVATIDLGGGNMVILMNVGNGLSVADFAIGSLSLA